jgi:hypothetical protein
MSQAPIAHAEGTPGDYGFHPTFAHGGEFRLRLAIHPPVDSPFVVEVRDAGNNPVSGATVVFEISQGRGRVNPSSVVTSADGRASTRLTTGSVVGEPQGVAARIAATSVSALDVPPS